MEETRNASTCSNGEEEDRISRLPDNLIHHILSFIDTKFAVQTSLLSKRWIDVWKSLSFLNFDRSSFSDGNIETERFIECVYMVFMYRDDTNVQKFNVGWEGANYYDSVIPNVNRWILFAVKHNVQEITLRIPHDDSAYEIPQRLLNCKSLRKLEITLLVTYGYANITLPRSMKLPQLEVLLLEGLSFSNIELYKRLISSCPVLETLTVIDCDIQTDNQRNLIVDSVSLKTFKYTCLLNYAVPEIIKLSAPNLKRFSCRSFFSHDFSLESTSPLSSVRFEMYLDDKLEDESAEIYLNLFSKIKKPSMLSK